MMTSLLSTIALALLAAADTARPAAHDLEELLAKPVSPGVIALLLPHLSDERAAGRVMESLSHPAAPVRATAARVSSVAGLVPSGPRVRRALESETDRSTAAEQLRAAVLLGPAGEDSSLVPAAGKLDLVDLLAETLANARGPAAVPLLDSLRLAGLTASGERTFMVSATRSGREGLNVVAAAALRTGGVWRWTTVLSLARQPHADLALGLLRAAIGSPTPEIRAAVYWHLALTLAKGAKLAPELEAAIALTPEASSPDSADVNAAFALVVLRRAQQGAGFGGDWSARFAAGTPMIPLDASGLPESIARFLTKEEARSLSRRLTDGTSDTMFERLATPLGRPVPDVGAFGGLLIAGGLPPGTLRDILTVTGCKPAADRRAAGLVNFRPDGRPRQVSVADDPTSRACAEVAIPGLGLTLAPSGLVDPAHPERQTVVIVPLDEGALECADQPEPSVPDRVSDVDPSGPEKVKEPRKVKNVAPTYPARALATRLQGLVILEAFISPAGCVRSARVLRGVSPELDASAMIAVGQWRYTPTLLNGRAVPVIMTVTVNFRLH